MALEPDRQRNAEIVLDHVEPINQRHGFMAKVDLEAIPKHRRRLVQTVLNAAMTLDAVQRHDRGGAAKRGPLARFAARSSPLETTYLIRSDLFKTLLLYRAGSSILDIGRDSPHKLADARSFPLGNGRGTDKPQQIPHLQAAKTSDHDGELRGDIWNALLGAIDLDLKAASRVKDHAVRDQAIAAWHAIHQLSQGNERFRAYLNEIEAGKAEAVEQKCSELGSRLGGNAGHIAILHEVVGDLDGMLRALLLLPEVGVLRELIDKLEDAAQSDSSPLPGEEKLLELLRTLEITIRQIDKGSADGWMRIARMIHGQAKDEHLAIRDLDPINKTAF